MEVAVENIEEKMRRTDEQLDSLTLQVGNMEVAAEEGEMGHLLEHVQEVQNNYQQLRADLHEVQELQRQLSSSLQVQLKTMLAKFQSLKQRLGGPGSAP